NDGVGRLDRVRITDDAHFNLAWKRAIAQLDSRDCQNFFANRFLNQRFAHCGNAVRPALDWERHLDDRMQNRQHEFPEHGLKLARRSRENKNVWRRNPRIDVRLQIKSRSASVLVRKDVRACHDIRLACNTRSPLDPAHLQPLLKPSQQLGVLTQLQPEGLSDHLPSDIVRGWPETAGDEENLATRK